MQTSTEPSSGAYLFEKLLSGFEHNTLSCQLIAAFLVFLQAVFVNIIASRQRMTEEVTLIPGLTFILLSSICVQFFGINPYLIANFFILLALYEMFDSYNVYSCADKIYNIGLWIALAGLFCAPYLFLIIFAWIGLGIQRANKLKERVMLLAGYLSPFILILTLMYWNDTLPEFYELQFGKNLDFLSFKAQDSIQLSFSLGFFILLLLIALFSLKTYNYRMKIKVQKIISILFFLVLTSLLTLFFQHNIMLQHLMVLIPALSFLISINFVRMPKHWAEIFHLFFLVAVVIWQYLPLLNLF